MRYKPKTHFASVFDSHCRGVSLQEIANEGMLKALCPGWAKSMCVEKMPEPKSEPAPEPDQTMYIEKYKRVRAESERQRNRARDRKNYANMTPEQRDARRAKQREAKRRYLDSMTPDQRRALWRRYAENRKARKAEAKEAKP